MIQCPGCGAFAQWGAPECPNCHAPFVAPPASSLPLNPYAAKQAGHSAAWVAVPIGIAVLGIISFLAFNVIMPTTLGSGSSMSLPSKRLSKTTNSMIQVASADRGAMAKAAEPPTTEGIFKITQQPARPPIVAIGNDSPLNMRIQLSDVHGISKVDWVPAWQTKEFTVPPGVYSAYLNCPSNPAVQPAIGDVRITNFHHYQAEFVLSASRGPSQFYVGD